MAVQDNTYPYEILIRFGEDGKPRGAHVQRQRIVVVDGEKLKHDVLHPEPLGLNDFPTSALMTDATKSAIQAAAELTAKNEALTAELAASQTKIKNMIASERALNDDLVRAEARIAELEKPPEQEVAS